jgi:hypothetical protein
MSFLDNSGDIILDAVLTDTGRFRLARGDGSFKIAKFALGDEEIDYGNYNKNHDSGSAYYDLNILQTPILEAFTNNTSIMKTKLVSISRTNLLYLPILKRNTKAFLYRPMAFPEGDLYGQSRQRFLTSIACTDATSAKATAAADNTSVMAEGVLGGNPGNVSDDAAVLSPVTHGIRLDQGLDTNEISPSLSIDQDLYETQYLIEIDNRFGSITPPGEGPQTPIAYAFKDDDEIASYYVSDADGSFVVENQDKNSINNSPQEVIKGPRGSSLTFSIRPSLELQQSSYLFDRFGSQEVCNGNATVARMKFVDSAGNSPTMKFIDTIVRVTGVTTGYRMDVPVRFIRIA